MSTNAGRHWPTARNVLLATLDNAGQVEDIESALHENGYRIVPVRRPRSEHLAIAVDGKITGAWLIEAAREFDDDGDGTLFSASDFIAWLLVDVEGSAEARWELRASRRRNLKRGEAA